MVEDKCKAAEQLVDGLLARVERRQQREQLAREQGHRAKQESRAALLALDELRGTGVAVRSRSSTEDVCVGCDDVPGRYLVEFEGTEVTESLSLVGAGASLKRIRAGSVVEVVEVVSLPDEDRVRGRITSPDGWISLLEMSSGLRWASELPRTCASTSAFTTPARTPRRPQSPRTPARPQSPRRQKSSGRLTANVPPSGSPTTLCPTPRTKLAAMGREELVDLAVLAVSGGA